MTKRQECGWRGAWLRCENCGRFVSFAELDSGKAVVWYQHETDYSDEEEWCEHVPECPPVPRRRLAV